MFGRMLEVFEHPALAVLGCLCMAVLLGSLTWLDFRDGGIARGVDGIIR